MKLFFSRPTSLQSIVQDFHNWLNTNTTFSASVHDHFYDNVYNSSVLEVSAFVQVSALMTTQNVRPGQKPAYISMVQTVYITGFTQAFTWGYKGPLERLQGFSTTSWKMGRSLLSSISPRCSHFSGWCSTWGKDKPCEPTIGVFETWKSLMYVLNLDITFLTVEIRLHFQS